AQQPVSARPEQTYSLRNLISSGYSMGRNGMGSLASTRRRKYIHTQSVKSSCSDAATVSVRSVVCHGATVTGPQFFPEREKAKAGLEVGEGEKEKGQMSGRSRKRIAKRGGIRDKQTNLDKGSSGGSAGEQRGLRCLRGGLPSTDPELRLRCCLAALSSGCQHALIYQGGHASRHPRSPLCPAFIKSLPDGSDRAGLSTDPQLFHISVNGLSCGAAAALRFDRLQGPEGRSTMLLRRKSL
ncbi:hypothetical protein KUCAC02_023127, partial [Chaenocephalus aceratus]